jgi:hypothetical protein
VDFRGAHNAAANPALHFDFHKNQIAAKCCSQLSRVDIPP